MVVYYFCSREEQLPFHCPPLSSTFPAITPNSPDNHSIDDFLSSSNLQYNRLNQPYSSIHRMEFPILKNHDLIFDSDRFSN